MAAPKADKRSAAYSDIFGRPSPDRRSAPTPASAPLHPHLQTSGTYTPPPGPAAGAYYTGTGIATTAGDRTGALGGQPGGGVGVRPMNYYPPPGLNQSYTTPPPLPPGAYGTLPPHPQHYHNPNHHPQQNQQYPQLYPPYQSPAYASEGAYGAGGYHYPEAGPSHGMPPPSFSPAHASPAAPGQLSPQSSIHQWQQSQPPYNGGYADPSERAQSFSSRTMSFGSRTHSFGDRPQSMGDRSQSFGDRSHSFGSAVGRQTGAASGAHSPAALTPSPQGHPSDAPRLPSIDIANEYSHPAPVHPYDRSRRQSVASGFEPPCSPDMDGGSGLGSIPEKGDSGQFFDFDQRGAAVGGPSHHPRYRRGSADSDAHSFYAGIERAPGTGVLAGGESAGSTGYPLATSSSPSFASPQAPPSVHSSSSHLIQPRKSSESVRVMPTQPKANSNGYDRSFSFSGAARPPEMRQPSHASSAVVTASRRSPVVYPALLSRVAEAFRSRIILGERAKDGLTYAECFDGREAVDKIAYIIKTTDRNLALLLGRALDAQKFFHDVTYDHRLRDSPHELYQFRARLASPFASREEITPGEGDAALLPLVRQESGAGEEGGGSASVAAEARMLGTSDELALPCGVFTLLTDCYSPTCTRDRLCYSIACPRRLEQQARLNLKPKPGLKKTISTESLGDQKEPGTLWVHSVPQEVVDSVSDQEKKRQEAINECIYTERDFVRDMEYLRDFWIKPLQTEAIIPEARRVDFVTQVFWNVLDVMAVNSRLCELLSKRQKSAHIVPRIGDIYLELVPHFSPFVQYGAHQLYGKYEFEKEKSSNLAFSKFVDDTERLPESRKLELNAYLTKPTTRLARYPLLLQVVEKYTPVDSSDKQDIPKVIKMIKELLAKVNVETGKSENRFNLAQLDQQLVFRQSETVNLWLRAEGREIIFKGPLKKRGGGSNDSAELEVFLFDHALLMVKQKHTSKAAQLKVYRKPIPLELLTITGVADDTGPLRAVQGKKGLITRTSTGAKPANGVVPQAPTSKQGFPITLNHLGRKGYSITLWAQTWASRQKWLDKIETRQGELRECGPSFEMLTLSDGFFIGTNKVNCAAPFAQGTRMVYGTDSGVYLASRDPDVAPVRVVTLINVTQVDVLEEQGILLVLADKAVMTFWVDTLDPDDPVGPAKRARKISSHASFFKVGDCLGRRLVCVVKSSHPSSTIKMLEPVDQHGRGGKKQPGIRKFLQGSNDALRVLKEFYIPGESGSVHFLKSKLCVGCSNGFQIVDLDTLDTQGLIDPADPTLSFVQKREGVRPVAIYRVEGDFLLCYDDFAFYVNKKGWRARQDWLIHWEGHPTAFALHYPYVLAFEPTFIEVRHVETGALRQIIPGQNIRHLFAETPPSTSASVLAASVRQSYLQNGAYGYQAGSGGFHHSHGFGRQPHSAMGSAHMGMGQGAGYRNEMVFASEGKVLQLKLANGGRQAGGQAGRLAGP